MFSLFSSPSYFDQELGELKRSRGMWRGQIGLMGQHYPLILSGTRKSPESDAISTAKLALQSYPDWCRAIEQALFEHYEPYAEALASEETGSASQLKINRAADVWAYVEIEYVAVYYLANKLATEIAYRTEWDEEHTVAARLQDGELIELCGSVLRP